MISYYELTKDIEEKGLEELEKEIFIKTSEYFSNAVDKFKKEIFDTVSDDIEKWIYERIDNTKRYFFDTIVNHLMGVSAVHVAIEDRTKIDEMLSGLGYTVQSFRKKLYEENKDVILKAIAEDGFYERLKPYERTFQSWDFSDITKGYPQSSIARCFLNELIEKDGFDDYMKSILSTDIQAMKNQRDELKKELSDILSQLEDIEDK
jgi:flagellar capping protein FliD